jgi:hypothetical protein
MSAHREPDIRTLHCGVVLQDDRRAAVVTRWSDRYERDVSIYGDPRTRPLPEARTYDDDELLASLGFIAADAAARLHADQDGREADLEELSARYIPLFVRVVWGAHQAFQGAGSVTL